MSSNEEIFENKYKHRQAPVKYRKPLAEVVLALSVFLDITALFNDYEI